jgi:PBP1b-binding outer membrane lipoprotein LpoB
MKISTLSLVSGVLLVSLFVAGCTSQQAPVAPTPDAVVEQPTEQVVNSGATDSGAVVAPNADIALTKEANTETSTIKWNAKKVGGAHF